MARVILITGGCRSGKSRHAMTLAESLGGRRAYVATCPVMEDAEMGERIARHQRERAHRGWETIEEAAELAGALREARGFEVVLVDCVTLWVNNLMYGAEERGEGFDEDAMERRCEEVLGASREREGTVIFVTNEVGMGIVPENALARRFRDLVGRCNQVIAAGADAVTLVSCGIPLQLKGA